MTEYRPRVACLLFGFGESGVNGNELHVYPFGGHGYGMRKTDKPVSNWPARARNLDASNGLDEGQMNKVNRAVRYLNHGSPSDVLRMENLTLGKLRSREVQLRFRRQQFILRILPDSGKLWAFEETSCCGRKRRCVAR